MKTKLLIVLCAGSLLGGCDTNKLISAPVVMEPPASGEATPAASGSIATTLIDTRTGSQVDADGNGYGYVVGYYLDTPGAGGFAGVTEQTTLGTQPITGTAAMIGSYKVARLDGLTLVDDRPTGSRQTIEEQITLTADFVAGTISGTQNDLSVAGTMSGGTLAGTVTYDGLQGALLGKIGATRAIGSFSGSDADTVYAGGFDVTSAP